MSGKQKFKAIFKSAGSLAWFIVSIVLAVVLTAVTILENTLLEPIFGTVLGGQKPIFGENNLSIYQSEYGNKEESVEAGNRLNVQIEEEGAVLLLNEQQPDGSATLPLSTSESDKMKVSVFGHNSIDLVLGGSGSGGIGGEGAATLYESLERNNFEYNETLKEFYESDAAGSSRTETVLGDSTSESPSLDIGETPVANYTSAVMSSIREYNDAAIVVISRVGGESFDLPRTQNVENGGIAGNHYLQLDQNEYDMLDMVTSRFDKVVVLLNTLQAFQCDFIEEYNNLENEARIDAVLWIGGPGSTGAEAIGSILNGTVNPSGRTVDTWARDFTQDPTYVNFGDGSQTTESGAGENSAFLENGNPTGHYMVTYEENVYVGYRYYETRGYEEKQADSASTWYEDNVIFPFGYGLSYTEFGQRIDDVTITGADGQEKDGITAADDKIVITATVENTGDRAGKGVIELYVNKPYTPGGIEKSYVELVDYAKSADLPAGESATFTFTIDAYDLASYDYNDANGNGFMGYELENGAYNFYVNENAHIEADRIANTAAVSVSVNAEDGGVIWNEANEDGYVAENRYTAENDYYSLDYKLESNYIEIADAERKGMSRTDFAGTFPKPLTEVERTLSVERDVNGFTEREAIENKQHNNTEVEAAVSAEGFELLTGQPTDMALRSLLGERDLSGDRPRTAADGFQLVEYDAEGWDELLNSLTFDDMLLLVNNGAFQTVALPSIDKNLTNDSDGPVGFVNFMVGLSGHYEGNTTFASQIVIGSTWNKDLAYQMGKIVGENGLYGDVDGNGLPYTGWYAPAVNLHRSPFSGRNFEYYSEDPVLSGKMAVNVINGCKTKGVYTDLKHFALNDQETNRAGISTFCTEQTLRELYLKPFEMAVKGDDDPSQVAAAKADGWTEYEGTTGMMSSFNRIGNRWTGGDYKLLTDILRGEWGFKGLVICDYKTDNSVMDSRQMLYAGNDLILASLSNLMWQDADENNMQDMYVLRKATKNILYTTVNSNAIQSDIDGYNIEWWKTATIVVDVVAAVGIVVWGVFAIRGAWKKAEQPHQDGQN